MLEKVHGTNFCLSTNGIVIRRAKRTAWLDDGDTSFFPTDDVVSRLEKSILQMHAIFTEKSGGAKPCVLFVYGELYGGSIQSEIFYQEEMDFVVFDALFGETWTDHIDLMRLCDKVGLKCLRPLMEGRLNKCFDFSADFQSSLGPDAAEGYVVKCSRELAVTDARGKIVRAVAKRKSERFLEVVQCGATSEEQQLQCYITSGRLTNVLSKQGPQNAASPAVRAQLERLLIEDAIEEASLQDPRLAKWVAAAGTSRVKALLENKSAEIVSQWAAAEGKKKGRKKK